MDLEPSLDYIIENDEVIRRFAIALDTENVTVKKQVFEILSALCVYSWEGYARVLDILEHCKITKKKRSRFSCILDEIQSSDDVSYKTNLLEFINCLIVYTEKPEDRVRTRNEFYGLRLQELLDSLSNVGDQNIDVQLQVFEENLKSDEEELPGTKGIDLGNPIDVFHAVHRQVVENQLELPFLTVLQHLLKIGSSNESISETIWSTVEQLVAKATVVESREDAQKLVTSISRRIDGRERSTSGSRSRRSSYTLAAEEDGRDSDDTLTLIPTPTPPPLNEMMPGAPPPPPPPPGAGGGPPPPPPPFMGGGARQESVLPQTNVPKPKQKMKSLNWQKIPINSVIGKPNLWTEVGSLQKTYNMDYERMDELFGVSCDSGPKRSSQPGDGQPDSKKKKESAEINILDGKRSLNVNIFLKQFRISHEEIVQMIRDGRREMFGAEKLRSLLKLLPSQEEIDAIHAFDGDREKLGIAEKFFIVLMGLPNYRMRLEGLLIMEEFNTNMEWIRPSIEAVIQAARDIQESNSLKELILLILISGNYLNSGNYAGNAAGFKISSLLKLTELRANKPGMNLMHYVAQEASEKNPKLLKFPEEMKFLKDASGVSVETLASDIKNIANKVRAITEQICMAGRDFQLQMHSFLKDANIEVVELEDDLNEIEEIRSEMATYFCEDVSTFKLEEFFRILQTFCDKLKKAHEENIQRSIQEAKVEEKRNKRENEEKRRSRDLSEPSNQTMERSLSTEKKGTILDVLLADVRSGFTSSKLNDGNFSVTKITKVNLSNTPDLLNILTSDLPNLDSNGSGFIRGDHGRTSQRRKRGDGSIDSPVNGVSPTPDSIPQVTLESQANEQQKPETTFERYASLRRRRLERKQKKPALEVIGADRERAPSPSLQASTSSSVTIRQGRDNSLTSHSAERPKSDNQSDSKASTLRRTRSWMDRPKKDQNGEDESEALINRLKQKLGRKDGRTTPTTPTDEPDGVKTESASSARSTTPTSRGSTKWRNNISVSDINSPLEPITEKNPTLEDFTTEAQIKAVQKTRDINRFRSSLDPKEVNKVLENMNDSSTQGDDSKHAVDDLDMRSQPVSKSVRLRMSEREGTNIDQLLKTVENTQRQIDCIGVAGPIQKTSEAQKSNGLQTPQPQVAVVAHVTASVTPCIPEHDLKAKREMRKKRSTLSMEDVKAAMKLEPVFSKKEITSDNENSVSNHSKHNNTVTMPSSKTPPSQRKGSPLKEKENKEILRKESGNNKELSKAAKLAGKTKFRSQRFGAPSTSDSNFRARSNVEPESVDQALKELISKSNMSRSKSFDENVDEKSLNSNGMRNSGSAPDTSQEKQAMSRSSSKRLSLDGRRNGLYVPDDDSDSEKKSKHSSKSANTSTETIPGHADSSPEQKRKAAQSNSAPVSSFDESGQHQRPNNLISSDTGPNPFRRSHSLLDKSKQYEEDSDDPNAYLAKWRLKREKNRRSMYDNVYDSEVSTEAGSRSSYASSKDEGFESGSLSQRTSMSSTLEAEYNGVMMRKADTTKQIVSGDKNLSCPQISGLSEEDDRKSRTEYWTAQTVKESQNVISKEVSSDLSESSSILSPDSGISTTKDDYWSDDTSTSIKSNDKSPVGKTTTTKVVASKPAKSKPVPSYMMPVNRTPARPASTTPESSIKRDTPNRTSVMERSVTPTFKRETTVRASMKAELSTNTFQRGTVARTSVRGPRTSLKLAPDSHELASSTLRQRADSNASVSSRLSTTSNASATRSNASSLSKPKSNPTPSPQNHSASASSRLSAGPSTPLSRSSTPVSTPTKTAISTPSTLSRTQSVRVTSSRKSLGADTKPTTSGHRGVSSLSQELRRSMTPLPSESSGRTTPLPERPHSTTPMSQGAKVPSSRRSFMAPTAASKARTDDQTPVPPPRTKSLINKASPLTRHSSLRIPKTTTSLTSQDLASGRKSPAILGSSANKPDHHQSLSTVTEQAGDEAAEEDNVKKSASLLKRLGRGSMRVAPMNKSPTKTK